MTDPFYTDYGSVEGTLVKPYNQAKTDILAIQDHIFQVPVTCIFPKRMQQKALHCADPSEPRRVCLEGPIMHMPDGTPINIRVERFRIFPPDSELPTIEDVIGIFNRP